MKLFTTLLVFLLGVQMMIAQNAADLRRSGDRAFEQQDFNKAEKDYRAAESEDPSFKSTFNLGNSLYEQKKIEEAEERFNSAITKAKTDEEKSRAYYNLANTSAQKQDWKAAIENYRRSLKYNPDDNDASYNYQQAMIRQKQQQQQQQQQQESGENQNQEDQGQENQDQQQQQDQENQNQDQKNQQDQEQQDQQEKNGDQQEQSKDQQQQDGDEQQGDQQEQSGAQSDSQKMNKEEAKRLLEIMEEQEQKTQEKLRRGSGKKVKPKKDW